MKILILDAHLDDLALGLAGTVSKHIEQGDLVQSLGFSDCEGSIEKPKQLWDEWHEASDLLDVENDINLMLEVGEFHNSSKLLRESLHGFNSVNGPFDIVYTHSRGDIHEDHVTLTREAIKIFKHTNIFGYIHLWNDIPCVDANHFVKLTQAHVDKKLAAIALYKTQAHRPYANPEIILSQLRVNGLKIGCEWAETFEVIRSIW